MTASKKIARAIKRVEDRLSNVEEKRDPDAVVRLLREPEDGVQTAVADDDVEMIEGEAASMTFDEDDFDFSEFA